MQNSILTNRSIVKNDRISKILSNYKTEIDKHSQQSFRMLSQKIKRKIGNQISDNQANYPIPKNKTDVSKFFSDHSKSQFQINVKDLLMHKSQISKQLNKKGKDNNKQMVPRINKTQNDIFKNYLAQRNCNGSQTYRDSRDLDARIKISDKSTHSQQALLQTLINKSYENKLNQPRDSPELCYASQHIFNILQQSINGQSSLLLRYEILILRFFFLKQSFLSLFLSVILLIQEILSKKVGQHRIGFEICWIIIINKICVIISLLY
ncbi:unnamed protein product [Paramecium sonneborni]|uniref:Transmembrane protein n=1 Tax=Paramecium sonneborni TaxID=65129 RepID=A0A8S1QBJ3_9CILI|nr:unnamed protein product [Paramecium sonneborni]